jgi:GxxExxY protein
MTELIYADLTYQVRGALYEVYNELRRHPLSEAGWEKALWIALQDKELAAHSQVEYELRYKDYRIGRFFVDILVGGKLLLELKARSKLQPIDEAQVITYLKVTNLKLGLLVNFGGSKLEIKRIPNFISQRAPLEATQVEGDQTSDQWLYPILTKALRGLLYEVHHELGPGFMHMHYRRATQIELRLHDIPYEVKKEVVIQFRQQSIETYETRLIIVDNKVLLACVAVREITMILKARFRQYLKLLKLKIGLIANFHATRLEIETVRI